MCSPKGYGKVSEQKLAYLHMIKAIHPAFLVGEEDTKTGEELINLNPF